MSPYEDRRRKFIDNLKLHGKFDDFKTKRAKREKERRLRLKEALTKMPVAKRNQLIEENRVKNRKDVQQFRMRQKELKSSNNTELKVSVSDEISENQLPKQSISEDHRKETLKLPKQNCENKVPFTENCQPPPSNNDQLMPTSKSEKQMFQSSNISHGIEVTNAESNEKDSLSQPTNKDQNQKLSTKKCQNKQSSTASTEDRQAQSSAAPCPKDSNSQPATSKEIGKHNELVVTKSIDFEHSYKTQSALSKAVAKTKKSLPSSPSKRKAVVARLLRTFNEDDQRDIIGNTRSKENKTNRGLSSELIEEVRLFYERDSISRISPNVKDSRKFIDPNTGEKVVRQIRHLNYKLSEVYDMFMDDCKDENGEDNRPPIKLSKFCALRPLHVFLMSETPQNACFCLYHSNFIQCAESLHKNNPEIPDYRNYELTDFLVCDVPTRDCYFKTCKKCSRTKIDKKIEDIVKRSPNNNKMVKWMAWTKDETANRFQNVAKEGTQHQLMEYFLSIYPKFLLHFYIKKEQEKTFTAHRKRVNSDQYLTEAVLQIDFAENFKCECQDEVQQAHYNQKQISLFTTALHHAKVTHSKVIASDNTHHGKETLVAYLYTIFKGLPSTITTVNVWSDGPSSQFKNKFIAAIIPVFQDMFGVTIFWNFFATGHGKSCIDGIGAAVKSKVKGMVLTREAIVNNTKEFVTAFNSKSKSKISLIEMADVDIEKINKILKLDEIFAKAPAVRDISKFHKIMLLNNKIKGSIISADV